MTTPDEPDPEMSTRVRKPAAPLEGKPLAPAAIDAMAEVKDGDVAAAEAWWRRHAGEEFGGLLGGEDKTG